MPGDATKAMPGRIEEERRRRRRPRAAATACGVWPFARDAFQENSLLSEKSSLRRELQKARHDSRIHFSAACYTWLAAWLRFTLLRFAFHGLERVLVRY